MIHFICALKCEASPIIDYYKLKHFQKADLFKIYRNDNHGVSVTITGIGKLAAAAATSYSYSILGCGQGDVWLNLGVAGHRSHTIGDIYLANRIEDAGSARVWYPQVLIDTEIPTASLLTLDQPCTDYNDSMFDMEAAGFIVTACRFNNAEFIQSIKIISDNQEIPAREIAAKTVRELIEATKEKIVVLASQLNILSCELKSGIDISKKFQQLSK
jgi:nucleoside phosphorylase